MICEDWQSCMLWNECCTETKMLVYRVLAGNSYRGLAYPQQFVGGKRQR